jgi:serine/threonine protein kinase
VQQLSYKEVRGHQQQQQEEEEGQVAGASNSSSASSSATVRMAQDRAAVHYMDKGEKKWVQATPVNPDKPQHLALKVCLGWHELDAQQRQQVDETPYAFAAMQLATLRKEVAMCQLANSEYVVAAYGVGIMHGTPASPNPTSATTAAAAAAATAADPAPSTPPAASAAATPAAPAGAGKHRVSQQLPVAAMLMERASCSLSHYIQQPHGATGAGDVPSVAALGLRHSPQLRDEAKDLLCQLIRALRKLEHLNVLHRDIKSENLLLFKSAAASPSAHSGASPSAAAGAASGAPSSPAAEAAPAAGGPAAAGKRSRWHLKLADFGVAWQGSTARPRAKSMGGTPGFLTPEATSNFQSDNSSNTYWVSEPVPLLANS